VITLWDVLEHLPNPRSALEKCWRLLKTDGLVVFSIPNLASYDRYIFGNKWIGWDAPRHFTLFTKMTLNQIISDTNFLIIGERCFIGGKGTFLLSLDNVFDKTIFARPIKKTYPILSALLWPYRQFSYLTKRGPILAIAARKQKARIF
jgi:SAM-dependent methyltransferase